MSDGTHTKQFDPFRIPALDYTKNRSPERGLTNVDRLHCMMRRSQSIMCTPSKDTRHRRSPHRQRLRASLNSRNRRVLISKIPIRIMLNHKLTGIKPVIEDLAPQHMLIRSRLTSLSVTKVTRHSPCPRPSKGCTPSTPDDYDPTAAHQSRGPRMPREPPRATDPASPA